MRIIRLLLMMVLWMMGLQPTFAQWYIETDKDFDKAMYQKWLERQPFVKGEMQQFDYILTKFVMQGRAEIEEGSIPTDYRWRCIDLKNECKLPENLTSKTE